MSYQQDRERFIAQVSREGLPYHVAITLLRQATTINRLAELACSSEEADRDRVPCPKGLLGRGVPCLCDASGGEPHQSIPRIQLQDWQAERRAQKAMPEGWTVITEGDPRGYTLKVIPPSYQERNQGRDRHNLEAIGVPPRESGIKW